MASIESGEQRDKSIQERFVNALDGDPTALQELILDSNVAIVKLERGDHGKTIADKGTEVTTLRSAQLKI